MLRSLFVLFWAMAAFAAAPVYVVLWFDTEDYITPEDDEACLRLARDLTARGVEATFKIVGEKARVLEQRKRVDVIAALKKHDIAYHSENHSIPPTPAVYLRRLGMEEGAAEWMRREGPGARDVARIFGAKLLSTYGQPGSSWGPQSHAAIRKLGIPSYVDEGSHVGLNNQPFWYGGLLWIFNLKQFAIRVDINDESKFGEALAKARQGAAELSNRGGGVMHFWYHPNEFVTTEFWDGVNFSRGANPRREDWKPARLRTKESSEKAYAIFNRYIDELKRLPNVRFASVRQLLPLYAEQPSNLSADRAKELLRESLNWRERWSAAELTAAALGVSPATGVLGPRVKRASTYPGTTVPRRLFTRAVAEAQARTAADRALPAEVWLDSETLAMTDFAATLAHDDGRSAEVTIHRGRPEFEKYVATDACRNFNWVIHPAGFCPTELYELGRLEAWSLKPAQLRVR